MKAFWSTTDNDNENMAQTYMVIGNLDKAQPSYEVSFACAGIRAAIELWDIVEAPEFLMSTGGRTYKLQDTTVRFIDFPFPAEWLEQVKQRVYTYGNYGAANYGAGWMTEQNKKKTETPATTLTSPNFTMPAAGTNTKIGPSLYQRIQEVKASQEFQNPK